MNRRTFIKTLPALGVSSLALTNRFSLFANSAESKTVTPGANLFGISLSQWSFHRAIFGNSRANYAWFLEQLKTDPDAVLQGELDPRDIVLKARALGVDRVDLVNLLFYGHAQDQAWLKEFLRRGNGEGVSFEMLMLDETGSIGASSAKERKKSIDQVRVWIDCARTLGCSSIRVNAYGDGTYLQQLNRCAESLQQLGELGKEYDLEIMVENHGHPSSNGAWLAMLMQQTNHAQVGVLADFDNFFMGGWGLKPERRYDTTQGMLDLAPYTRAVSAKSYDFDSNGVETKIDFEHCMQTVLDAGFKGIASAEYEGEHLSEWEGTKLTVELLRSVRETLG